MRDRDRQAWFSEEILVHEGRLRGYLTRFLSEPCDVEDAVQETYVKLLGLSARQRAKIRSSYAFLFTTARNVAVDRLRKRQVVSLDLMAELDSLNVIDQSPSAYEQVNSRQELAMLTEAIAQLPDKCRQVLTLRKLYGLSQKEIARRLGVTENTVEKHVANGLRHCAAYLFARDNAAERSRHKQATRDCHKIHEESKDVGSRD